MWWGCSILSSPLILTWHHEFPFIFMESMLFSHSQNRRPWKFKASLFPKKLDFFFLALWKWKTLKHFGTTGSYLQEGEDGISPLFPLQGQPGPQDHQRPGSQAGVGVWALSCAGEGCLTVRHWRIVSRLKNGLNWPAMEKSTAGSFGAACSDLGEVSQEISNSAGFLS